MITEGFFTIIVRLTRTVLIIIALDNLTRTNKNGGGGRILCNYYDCRFRLISHVRSRYLGHARRIGSYRRRHTPTTVPDELAPFSAKTIDSGRGRGQQLHNESGIRV